MRLLLLSLFFLATVTSSWDLIGVLDVAGGNLRICSFFMVSFITAAMIFLKPSRVPRVRAFMLLLIWFGFNLVGVTNAPQVFRTYAYLIWLTLDVALIFACAAAFRTPRDLAALARWNYYSFIPISLFGLIQFAAYPLGINLLVEQTWVSALARINGFSYEPSYYSTYMIVGWAMSLVLLVRGVHFLRPALSWVVFGMHTAVLVLCSSRIGYLGMVVMSLVMAPTILKSLRTSRVSRILTSVAALGAVVLIGGGAVVLMSVKDSPLLLEGTGLGGAAAHSVDQRMAGVEIYEELFMANPLKGYSVGGIAAQIAGADSSMSIDYEAMRQSQGCNVSLEILLATGIVGAPFFFWYFVKLTFGSLRRIQSVRDARVRAVCAANIWGLIMQFFLLQFNQNILRNYFWIQIAVVSCLVTHALRQMRGERALPARESLPILRERDPAGLPEPAGLSVPRA
jgi:hypothetical protein